MSRRSCDATGRAIKDTAHVRLHSYLLKCAAWRSLSVCARAGLVEIYALYHGGNNGDLFMSERELGRRLAVDRRTARKALADLADRGFIAVTERGGFSRKVRHATSWRLTEHVCDGRLPTKDFMRWPLRRRQQPVLRASTATEAEAPIAPARKVA